MGRRNAKRHYCRCCDSVFWSYRFDAKTCSPACRQMVSRALRAGIEFGWGKLKQPALFNAGGPAGVNPPAVTKRGARP